MDDEERRFGRRKKKRDRGVESRGKRQNVFVEFREVTDYISHTDLTQTIALVLVLIGIIGIIVMITAPDAEERFVGGFESSNGVSDGGCGGGETS